LAGSRHSRSLWGKASDSTDPDEAIVAATSGRDNLSDRPDKAVGTRSDDLSFDGLGKTLKNYVGYVAIARGAAALRVAKEKPPQRELRGF
jgi:hypothetical protein